MKTLRNSSLKEVRRSISCLPCEVVDHERRHTFPAIFTFPSPVLDTTSFRYAVTMHVLHTFCSSS